MSKDVLERLNRQTEELSEKEILIGSLRSKCPLHPYFFPFMEILIAYSKYA